MKKMDDFRFQLGDKEYAPIMTGGMGVDISTAALALEAARLGGIGHVSDALIMTVADRYFDTNYVREKHQQYKLDVDQFNKAKVQFDLEHVKKASEVYVSGTMNQKKGDGGVFINIMEKLTMNNPKYTLKARMEGAMDGGIDGITLSAGLHLGSLALVADHPRFRDVKFGIIVSSLRALQLFLKKTARLKRTPDFIVIEGPLAGGHLGFGLDWAKYDLRAIVPEVIRFLKENDLNIPVVPAGGIFTGSDGVEYLEMGAGAIQIATRATITKECGLPDKVKQIYVKSQEEDIEVNTVSPTGYPMRMLKGSPAIGSGVKPNCESLGYLLDKNGDCSYIKAYNKEVEIKNKAVEAGAKPSKLEVYEKTCMCTQMRNFRIYTCGHYAYRLKDTTNKLPNGDYQLLTTEELFDDYLHSVDHQIKSPALPEAAENSES